MDDSTGPAPKITVYGTKRPDEVRAVVLVLHGGREHSRAPATRFQLAYLRMLPFAKDIARKSKGQGVSVWVLKDRYRGWNAPDLDPVRDAEWALGEIRATHGDVPVVLVGHSMGGRVALRVAGDPSVIAVCALAPWTAAGEPVRQLAGRTLLIAHGLLDRTTDPRLSYSFAERAKAVTDRVVRFDVAGERHAMLRKADKWTRLVTGFVLGVLDTQPIDPVITNAMGQPAPEGLRVPL
ncbi:alpha/beta fold hydrolase [Actinokineospora sp. NBRC 105648]|uniref:alpha/beta hydrolase n=1 Tax=Actinokineospora sp. NBRC 105648 TaxID=3032206 RepID=UPI0024A52D90|nr:alpha/beta fold hydrolase [Actinokineospora sp. NBRC 105648]GLZ40261.1 alpha/beta hydrolase [Actinokineospora sp. NBRC 105648]